MLGLEDEDITHNSIFISTYLFYEENTVNFSETLNVIWLIISNSVWY